jgi:hypothetical protein
VYQFIVLEDFKKFMNLNITNAIDNNGLPMLILATDSVLIYVFYLIDLILVQEVLSIEMRILRINAWNGEKTWVLGRGGHDYSGTGLRERTAIICFLTFFFKLLFILNSCSYRYESNQIHLLNYNMLNQDINISFAQFMH